MQVIGWPAYAKMPQMTVKPRNPFREQLCSRVVVLVCALLCSRVAPFSKTEAVQAGLGASNS